MKAFFRPLYLFIAATVLVLALLIALIFVENSPVQTGSRVYVIGYDATFYPYDTAGKDRQFSAFLDELLEKVADNQEISIRTDKEPFDSLFPALRRGALDAVCTVDNPNETMAVGRYAFSEPIYDFGPVIVVRMDSNVTDLAGLKGMVVGITRGSTLASELSIDPTIFVVTYDGILQALERLADKSVDAVLLPYVPAYSYSHSLFRGQMRVATAPLIHAYLRMVTQSFPSGIRLLHDFNHEFKKLQESGEYDALLARWGLPNPQKPEPPQGSEESAPQEPASPEGMSQPT